MEGGATKPSGISGGLKGSSSSGLSKEKVSISSEGLALATERVEAGVEESGGVLVVRRRGNVSLVVGGRREKQEEEEARREREERELRADADADAEAAAIEIELWRKAYPQYPRRWLWLAHCGAIFNC